mmetsp:Transcript_6394/g.18838  ORF Transcript_6394/g.18838 Transcript_6394/m.18838 type:complete len:523 (-) Transcript_6394:177-1745(-)
MEKMDQRNSGTPLAVVHKRRAGGFPVSRPAFVSAAMMAGGSARDESKQPRRKIRLPNTVALLVIVTTCAMLIYVSSLYDKDHGAERRRSDQASSSAQLPTNGQGEEILSADVGKAQAAGGSPLPSPSLAPLSRNPSLLTDDDYSAFYTDTWAHLKSIITTETALVWPRTINNIDPLQNRTDFKNLTFSGYSSMAKRAWQTSKHPYIYVHKLKICASVRAFQKHDRSKRHVLIQRLDENFGALTNDVPSRTKLFYGSPDGWLTNSGGCKLEELMEYLNHPNTIGLITTQHHAIDHPKAHSLPLGIKPATFKIMNEQWLVGPKGAILNADANIDTNTNTAITGFNKTQLLMINDSGWQHRAGITKQIIRRFDDAGYHNINNTYCRNGAIDGKIVKGHRCPHNQSELYVDELARSKFILCPSGLGWDSYRIWESLSMMTFPVIERFNRPYDGWRRSLDNLPVVWVDHFDDLTPELLEDEYRKLIALGSANYEWQRLTKSYWTGFIESLGAIALQGQPNDSHKFDA